MPSCDVKTQAENVHFGVVFSARKDRITWWSPSADNSWGLGVVGKENPARSFSDRSFLNPPGVMVRTEMLVFTGFRGPDRSFCSQTSAGKTAWTSAGYPAPNRSAPKGRQQMGETGFCKNLRFSAVSCANLRFPAVFCANLRLPNPLIYRANQWKSAKICENVRSGSGFSLLLSPFWRALTKTYSLGCFFVPEVGVRNWRWAASRITWWRLWPRPNQNPSASCTFSNCFFFNTKETSTEEHKFVSCTPHGRWKTQFGRPLKST